MGKRGKEGKKGEREREREHEHEHEHEHKHQYDTAVENAVSNILPFDLVIPEWPIHKLKESACKRWTMNKNKTCTLSTNE